MRELKILVMINSGTRDQEALQVAEEIVAVRAQLAALVQKFHAIVGGSAGSTTLDRSRARTRRRRVSPVSVQPPGDATQISSGSSGSRILAVFTRQPGKKLSMQNVVTELADISPSVIRSTVARFARGSKKLKKVSRGVYKSVPTAADRR